MPSLAREPPAGVVTARNCLKKHCERTLASMDLRFAECTKWFAEFADIVYDIDHRGCLNSYDDVGFTPHSDRQSNDNLTIMLAAPA